MRRPQNGPQRPQNGPQRPQEAEIIYDMPIALKTAQLGSKSDIETKAMLKKMLIGFGAASCLIIVYLIFRVSQKSFKIFHYYSYLQPNLYL